VVGFSKLIGEDEAGTLSALRELRKDIVNPILAEHHGLMFDDGRRRHACRATEKGRMKARRDFWLDAPTDWKGDAAHATARRRSGCRTSALHRGVEISDERVEGRLVAILAGDVVGYSRLMGADEG
jgi:class 3 adenylate cyclase